MNLKKNKQRINILVCVLLTALMLAACKSTPTANPPHTGTQTPTTIQTTEATPAPTAIRSTKQKSKVPIPLKNIRLAIIDVDRKNAQTVDLLTVELSENPNILLLERADIDKIMAEHSISANNIENDSFQVGKLLGADAVLCLNQETKEKKKILKSSLTAVNVGVIVKQWYSPSNLAEKPEWLNKHPKNIIANLNKLNVSKDQAIPISYMGMAAMNPGKGYKEIETKLNKILPYILIHEPSIFVLDRWNMKHLHAEKTWKEKPNKFWTGAYIIEGEIKTLNVKTQNITLLVKLHSPDKKITSFEVLGNIEKPFEICDEINKRIILNLNKTTTTQSWKIQDEAQEFYKYAQWCYRTGLNREALNALEASIAMGYQNKWQNLFRMKILTKLIYPFPTQSYGPSYFHKDADSHLKQVPIDDAVYIMELYADIMASNPEYCKLICDKDTYSSGAKAVQAAVAVLKYKIENKVPLTEKRKIPYLKKLIHKNAQKVLSEKIAGHTNWYTMRRVTAIVGFYWCSTPEEAIAQYKKLFSDSDIFYLASRKKHIRSIQNFLLLRRFAAEALFVNKFSEPFIDKWSIIWPDTPRRKVFSLWSEFIEKLKNSPDPQSQCDGIFFSYYLSSKDEKKTEIIKEAKKFLIKNKHLIIPDTLKTKVFSYLFYIIKESPNDTTEDKAFWVVIINHLASIGRLDGFSFHRPLIKKIILNLITQKDAESIKKSISTPQISKFNPQSRHIRNYMIQLLKTKFPEIFKADSSKNLVVDSFVYPIPANDGKLQEKFARKGWKLYLFEEKVWLFSHKNIYAIDIKSKSTSSIPLPDVYHRSFINHFFITDKYIIMQMSSASNELLTYSRQTHKWKKFPIPDNHYFGFVAFDDLVFLAYGKKNNHYNDRKYAGIMKLDLTTENIQLVLNSSSKKPKNRLEKSGFPDASIFLFGKNNVGIASNMGQVFYSSTDKGENWKRLFPPTGECFYYFPNGKNNPILLLSYRSKLVKRIFPNNSFDILFRHKTLRSKKRQKPIFEYDENIDFLAGACFNDNETWLLCKNKKGSLQTFLTYCDTANKKQIKIPLKCNLPNSTKEYLNKHFRTMSNTSFGEKDFADIEFLNWDKISMFKTKQGLIISSTHPFAPGFWFIPEEKLQNYINK